MKKLNIRNFALFVIGCAIVGVCIYFGIVKNIFALQGLTYFIVAALCTAICGLVIYLLTFLIIKETKQEFTGYNFGTSNNIDAEKLINKIGGHMTKIKQLNDYIADKPVSDELSEIEKIMSKMQMQLKDEQISASRLIQVDAFLEYYAPLAVKIMNSYGRIENNELTGKNAMDTKKQISEILPVIKRAFEKELDNMFTDEMFDITTDIMVLETMLAKDDLIDKNNSI